MLSCLKHEGYNRARKYILMNINTIRFCIYVTLSELFSPEGFALVQFNFVSWI